MGHGRKVSCVLCQRSEETKITGALSTKGEVTAHQNCLLFSSGIYCRDSPQLDDLFGFSAEDVMSEVKRGGKLMCNKCKRKGATAGCEVGRCKKSYHYPCAVQEGAEIFEDAAKGKYGLYCFKHRQQQNGSVNGCASSFTKPGMSEDPTDAGSSKVYCLTCEKTEGKIRLESLSNSIIICNCGKHAPPSHQRNAKDDSTAAGLSVHSSDSNSSSSAKYSPSKRRLSFNDKLEETPSKRKSESWKRKISDDSSTSVEDELNTDMETFAPLEFDLDESANSGPESQLIRKDTEIPTGSTSGNQQEDDSRDGDEDDTTIDSEADSESVLPVDICMELQSLRPAADAVSTPTVSTADPSGISMKAAEVVKTADEGSSPVQNPVVHSPGQHTAGPPPSPDRSEPRHVAGSPPCTSLAISRAPPDTICVSLSSASPSPPVHPSDPEPSIDSASFWKSCNAAGCTQAIFTDFISEMNDISCRIQSDQASQEDYDLALTMMSASGKLAELVTKQKKELQRKQMELQKAAAAMKDVVSALQR